MKKLLLFLFLISSVLSFGQIELEHTYYYTRGVQRIVLENSGEKYYYVNYESGTIQFFNADHTPWKSVMIPLPSQNYSLGIYHISETKINPDANLEIVYSTYSAPNILQCKIINELGTVLLTVDNCGSLQLDQMGGSLDKVISSTGVVYSVPGLIIEHTYLVTGFAKVMRVKLENSGEKYYVLDAPNSLVVLYNADHTFWKKIVLPKPEGYSISNIDVLSENQLNSDNLIEVGYSCHNDAQQESRIANENGVTLLTATNPGRFVVTSIEGLPNKLMVYYSPGDLPDETSARTDVYSVPEYNLEHTYQHSMKRVKLENSGEKYHAYSYDYLTTDITIYNSDHTLWKTIAAATQGSGETIQDVFISETKIDPDNALELIYTISSNTLDGGHYYGHIVKDNGTVILDLPGAYDIRLSEFPNVSKKLMVYSQDGPSFDQLYYTSIVYKFNGTFAVSDFDKSMMSITPNPASSTINILSKSNITEATLYNSLGSKIKEIKDFNRTKINVESLPSGIYLLNLTDSNNKKSTHKIIISH